MEIIQEIGAYAGLGAVLGLAVLAALYFSQARDVKRLREWAGRGPERAVEQTGVQRVTPVPKRPTPAQPARPAPPAVPGAKPAPAQAAAAGAQPATAQAGPAAATPAAQAGQGAPTPATAAAGAAASGEKSDAQEGEPEEAGAAAEKEPAAAGAEAEAEAAGVAAGAQPATAAAAGQATGQGPEAPTGQAGPTAPEKPAGPAQAPGDGAPATPVPPARPPTPAGGPPKAPTGAPGVPAGRGRTPRVPSRPGRGRRPAPSQTAILPPRDSRERRRPWYRRMLASPRYLVVAIAGVLIIGGAVAFSFVELTKEEGADQTAREGGAGDGANGDRQQRRRRAAVTPSKVTVSVLNGTTVPGLAAQIGDKVEGFGFQLGNITNSSDQQRAESVVMHAPGAERAAAAVGRRLGIAQREPIEPDTQALGGDATVVVIAGADQTQ